MQIPANQVHRRLNPLTGDYVLVSPHRTQRPWQGKTESADNEPRPSHDSTCYLCPRNERAGGHTNPDYDGTFVFDNDFAALQPHDIKTFSGANGLLVAETQSGRCRVICFSPR